MQADYLQINRDSWNNKVEHHLNSDFYDQQSFLDGKNSLNDIELELLGDVKGKKVLHLQCHFGQDTISLARLGADVTGIDLSDKAIETAEQLAEKMGVDAKFICSPLYDLPDHLDDKFDVVFTSYGAICWLPDLKRWAEVISHFLKPGGRFVMAEFHPAVWMFDNDFKFLEYSYFNVEPIVENVSGSYADKDAPITQQYVTWNHSISDVLNNLVFHGLAIETFNEFDYSPYNFLNGTIESSPGKFRIGELGAKLPLVFSLAAVKKS